MELICPVLRVVQLGGGGGGKNVEIIRNSVFLPVITITRCRRRRVSAACRKLKSLAPFTRLKSVKALQ